MQEYGEPLMWTVPGRGRTVNTVLVVTVCAFLLQQFVDYRTGGVFTALFGLSWPTLEHGEVWRLVSYLFLHGGVWHILLNMFSLAIFGREIEEHFGARRFLLLYFGCGILAGLGWVLISGRDAAFCIGASGAVFGIMGAFAAAFPHRQLTVLVLFVLPVTMTARMMAISLGLITVMLLIISHGTVAHAAHLAGGIAGYLFGRAWTRSARGGGHLRFAHSEAVARWRSPWRLFSRREPSLDPRELDRILGKITEQGMGSLTRGERDILDRASGTGGTKSYQ